MTSPAVRKAVVRLAISIVVVNAAIGMLLVLFGQVGETEARILGTSSVVAVAAFGLLVLAPRRRDPWAAHAATVGRPTLLVAGAGLIGAIWFEEWNDTGVRLLISVVVAALALVVLATVGLIRTTAPRGPLLRTTFVVGVFVATGLEWMIWAREPSELVARVLGATAVLFAGLLLVLLIGGGGNPRTPGGKEVAMDQLVRRLHRSYRRRSLTLAVAESMTAGALMAAVGSVSGASALFRGGLVTYSLDTKVDLLGLESIEIEGIDAVSLETAEHMAASVRDRFGSDVGIGVTGWSEPWADHLLEYPRAAVAVVGPGSQVRSQWVLGAGDGRVAMIERTVSEALNLALFVDVEAA